VWVDEVRTRVHVTKTPKLANLDSILCFFVTRTRITSSTRHLESVLALTRHLIRLLAVRINSRVGDKNTLSWCLCSIKIEHAYTSHPLDTLVSDMHALTTVSEGEGSVCDIILFPGASIDNIVILSMGAPGKENYVHEN